MERRPLNSRNLSFFQRLATTLANKGIRPNSISLSSLIFAAIAAFFLCLTPFSAWWGLPAALFIQLRLIANLLDGMVAIEQNKKEPTGAFWNEAPDRPADIFILAGLGVAATLPSLGLLAGLVALMTAYLRCLGKELINEQNYTGPMAKPQRMFVATLAAALAPFLSPVLQQETIYLVSLGLIILGGLWTCGKRTQHILETLKR